MLSDLAVVWHSGSFFLGGERGRGSGTIQSGMPYLLPAFLLPALMTKGSFQPSSCPHPKPSLERITSRAPPPPPSHPSSVMGPAWSPKCL